MKITSFTYTDAKQKITQRVIGVTQEVTDKMNGVDLTGLTAVQVAEYASRHNTILQKFMEEVSTLNAIFDIEKPFRQFKPANMTDVVNEWL